MSASSITARVLPDPSAPVSVTNGSVKASTLSPALRPLRGAPGYFLGERFASGGMGAVHFGIKQGALGFQRIVAIKRMHPHLVENPEFVMRFKHEIRLVSRLSHPNIVDTLDVIEAQGELCLVMEYVEGETLYALLKDARESRTFVPIPAVVSILSQALHGLHEAHDARDERGNRLGLVHRDVSPQNIMLDKGGVVKILDFGVAKATGEHSVTCAGEVLGKVAYMSPEQRLAQPLDFRSDIFATGVVLWEALTGERLFRAPDGCELTSLMQLLNSRIRRPSELRKEVTPELDAIVLRALEREPARRFASARDFALALENVVSGATASAVAAAVAATCGDRALRRMSMFRALRAAIGSFSEQGTDDTASERAVTRSRLRAVLVPQPSATDGLTAATEARAEAGHCTGPLTVFVDKEEATQVKRRHRLLAWAPLPLAAFAASLVAGGLWVTSRGASSESAHSAAAPRPEQTPRPLAAPAVPSFLPKPASATPTSAPLPIAESPPPAAQPPSTGKHDAKASPSGGKPARQVKRQTSNRARTPNCSPPSYLDAQGIRHFKPECL